MVVEDDEGLVELADDEVGEVKVEGVEGEDEDDPDDGVGLIASVTEGESCEGATVTSDVTVSEPEVPCKS